MLALWETHGPPLKKYGIPMEEAHVEPMGLPWDFHGIIVLSRGTSMGDPWESTINLRDYRGKAHV